MAIEFKQHTLSNGLTIVAEVAPEAHTAAMGFFVKTGARDETPEMMGVSHFLEHMMFKGTDNRTAEQVDQEFDAIGADHNAFTSSEITAFWAHSLPESLPKAGEILSDILRPALRQEDFDAEKNVILEEIAMYQDQPFWILYERALEVYYDQHPLAHRVLGTPETIGPLPRDGMLEYFQRRYSADNTTVALAGRVDFERMIELIEKHCGQWQRTDTRREQPKFIPSPNEFTLEHESISRAYLLMASPAPSLDNEQRYAMSMLGQILGDSDGSRLYWALIETGLAEEAQAQYDGRDGLGDLLTFACCDPANLDEVEATIKREMEGIIGSLTEDDLQRVRSKVATGTTLQGELPGGRMRRLGQLWTYFGEYRSLEDELARINAVTLSDLRTVAEAYPLKPLVTGRLVPRTT